MTDEPPRPTRVEPVPGVTWRSHMGCGALFGFFAGFLGTLSDMGADGFMKPLLVGLGVAVLAGILAAVLGNRFWLR